MSKAVLKETRYELIKNMSIQDMAAAIAEIASDCRYCGDGCSDCDGGCLSCIEDKLSHRLGGEKGHN